MSKESFYSGQEVKGQEKEKKAEMERIKKIKESLKDEGIFIRKIYECLLIQRIPFNINKKGYFKEYLSPVREVLKEMQLVKNNSKMGNGTKDKEYDEIIQRMSVPDFFISLHVHGDNEKKKILKLAENDLLQKLGIKIEDNSNGANSKSERMNRVSEIQISKGELIGGCDD